MRKSETHEQYVADVAKINPDIEVVGTYKGSNIKIAHKNTKTGDVSYVCPSIILTNHKYSKRSK